MKNKYCFILGTRPEIIKLYSLIKTAEKRGLDYFIIHTNQHYDEKMDQIFFDELDLPKATYNLNIGSGSQADQTARMMIGVEKILKEERPTHVFVQGDTNTVLSGALVASKMMIKVVHIEAGLRSYDRAMPEEINRIITDHVSDYLMAPNKRQEKILYDEGISRNKIFVVGNTVMDAVTDFQPIVKKKGVIKRQLDLSTDRYILLTCHRPSNTDNEEAFRAVISAAAGIAKKHGVRCIFPMHPRLLAKKAFVERFKEISVIEPVGYLEMLELEMSALLILTDSGGIQEESAILHKKCLILRLNTERPEALIPGGSVLITAVDEKVIIDMAEALLSSKPDWQNSPFGDGKTAEKVFEILDTGHE